MSALGIIAWLARLLTLFALCGALLPLVRSGAWAVRVWDFPRVQMLIAIGVGLGCAAAIAWAPKSRLEAAVLACLLLFASVFHIRAIVPFTPLAPLTVPQATSPSFSVVVTNLDVRNQYHEGVREALEAQDADVLLLVELDHEWERELAALGTDYPHAVTELREDGLGIALWSRLPLETATVEYLVSDRRASIHATIVTPDGDRVRLIGIHPTPPALAIRSGEGRYDSRIRDAELVRVAEMVAEANEERRYDACIVAGDFNDVAWSHTTTLNQRLSGLEDPRVGRGLFSTYHAQRPLLRYPLDHVFVTPNIAVAHMRRLRIPGSDHFGIGASIEVRSGGKDDVDSPSSGDRDEASEMHNEGQHDAASHGESASG